MEEENKMNRQLFVCNSVYQVLVALWIKYIYHPGELSDIIILNQLMRFTYIVAIQILRNLFRKVFDT